MSAENDAVDVEISGSFFKKDQNGSLLAQKLCYMKQSILLNFTELKC